MLTEVVSLLQRDVVPEQVSVCEQLLQLALGHVQTSCIGREHIAARNRALWLKIFRDQMWLRPGEENGVGV